MSEEKGAGRLSGKVVVVTGAGTLGSDIGNGRAISILMAREGARVCLADLDSARAEETLAMVQAEGGEGFALGGDVSVGKDCQGIVDAAIERYGRIDVLVNCAGIGKIVGLLDIEEELWDRHIAVNLKSAVLMCKHAIPHMASAGGGAIVNITSVNGILSGGGSSYGASKAGLMMLTRDIAVDFGRQGIRANAVAPGHIWSPLASREVGAERERRRQIAPLGIEGSPWDVAWAVVYLASDEARFINGVCIPVDGGATSVMPLKASRFLDE